MISIRCTADSAACDSGGSTHGVADGEHGDGDVDGTVYSRIVPSSFSLPIRPCTISTQLRAGGQVQTAPKARRWVAFAYCALAALSGW